MKICKHCNAEVEDEVLTCPECGADMMEDEQPAASAEVQEAKPEASAEPKTPKKKTPWGLIIGLAAAALVIIALIVGKSAKDQKNDVPPVEEGTVETQEPAQEPAEDGQTPVEQNLQPELQAGHHKNSAGLPSHTIYSRVEEDGSTTFFYLDEQDAAVPVSAEELEQLMELEVATLDGEPLTNRELFYYYDQQQYSFFQVYGSYLAGMLDPSKGLDAQPSMDPAYTWEQFFLKSGLDLFHQVTAIYNEAVANGHTLTPEEEEMMDVDAQLEQLTAEFGAESPEDLLRQQISPAATLESYKHFMEINGLAASYANYLVSRITVTPEELNEYYDAHQDELMGQYNLQKIDKPMVSVRHILIQPEQTALEDGTMEITDEAWAAAEAKAQELYDSWQSGDATEESFAALASENTQDPGSKGTGGLYEGVYPGQMVPEFNDWCFADGRQAGDTGVVKTDYGYHIMFFVDQSDEIYWQQMVSEIVKNEKAAKEREDILAKYESTADLSKTVVLAPEPVRPEPAPEDAEPTVDAPTE